MTPHTTALVKRILFIASIALVFLAPLQASGMERSNYIAIKSGLYTFTDGLRDATLATGFDGEIAFGRYLHPNIILEVGIGYLHDGVNKGYGNSVKGEPILLTFKAVYPFRNLELFAGAGPGFYFTKFHGRVNGVIADKSDNVFGGHVVAGAQYSFSKLFFFGFEGRYSMTEKMNFVVFRPRFDGYAVTGSFGFRF